MIVPTVVLVLLAVIVLLLIAACVLFAMLQRAEEALDARFDEYGRFRYAGQEFQSG